jgi:DnaJ-class molecular chaperone
MEFKDYYTTLGVAKTATADEIKRAYRKLARQLHPDVNPGDRAAEARFKEINEAHEVLGDKEKRRKYDELGANWRQYEGQAAPGGAGSPGGYGRWPGGTSHRTMTPEEFQEMFGGAGGADPFSDFFHTFFDGGSPGRGGGARGGRGARPKRGHDLEYQTDLTLEEAFQGTARRVAIEREGGSRSVEVRIPAGVKDGARVRLAGEGEPAPPGGTAGDLYVSVRLRPHPRFERRGADLHIKAPVPLTTAVLGGEIAVPTLGGSTLRTKIPELTAPGRVIRLRGHGMPTVGKADERGDLYLTVEVEIPSRLSPEAREHYEALRRLESS